MYQYTEEQIVSMKKVEATRASRLGAELRRMTAEEKDAVLASFHPDYIASAYEELKVGPNRAAFRRRTRKTTAPPFTISTRWAEGISRTSRSFCISSSPRRPRRSNG